MCRTSPEHMRLPIPIAALASGFSSRTAEADPNDLCECSRCVFETEAAAADAIGLTELHAIATVAQQDGRFKDALKAYGAILAKEPADSHGRCQSHDHAFIVPERIVERS